MALAKARGEQFGEGRMFTASDAVARNMADRIGTMQETLDRIGKKVARASMRADGNPLTVFAAEDLPAPRAEVAEPEPAAGIIDIPTAEDLTLRLAAARSRANLAELANPSQTGLSE